MKQKHAATVTIGSIQVEICIVKRFVDKANKTDKG